ncbi:hypothetical protein [Demequina globuliformis]|nr:hypothetical protein [Demequina globuliformis]
MARLHWPRDRPTPIVDPRVTGLPDPRVTGLPDGSPHGWRAAAQQHSPGD